MGEAADLAGTPGALAANTVFDLTPASMNNPTMDADTLNAHLAEGIPALSGAAGITVMAQSRIANFDMNVAGKPDGGAWGRPFNQDYEDRWLHCDLREMAFLYTHKMFKKLVLEGEME